MKTKSNSKKEKEKEKEETEGIEAEALIVRGVQVHMVQKVKKNR